MALHCVGSPDVPLCRVRCRTLEQVPKTPEAGLREVVVDGTGLRWFPPFVHKEWRKPLQKRVQCMELFEFERGGGRAHPFSVRVGTEHGWGIYTALRGARLLCFSTLSSTRT